MTPENSIKQIRALFALRYQVYCVERGFLSPEEYPQQEERDEFDPWSVHFAALDADGEIAGSVRLVRPAGGYRLPFHEHCRTFSGCAPLPCGDAGEVSRLVMSRRYARRAEDVLSSIAELRRGPPSVGGRSICRSAEIVLSLYKAMLQYSKAEGVTYWYAAMERSLVRLLNRYGIRFRAVGPEADYFGPVVPHLASIHELLANVRSFSEELYAWFDADDEPGVGDVSIVRLSMPKPEPGAGAVPQRCLS